MLRDEGMSGRQNFFNHISVGFDSSRLAIEQYQLFFDEFLDVFRRKSAFAQGWSYSRIDYIPQADERYPFIVIFQGQAKSLIVMRSRPWGTHPIALGSLPAYNFVMIKESKTGEIPELTAGKRASETGVWKKIVAKYRILVAEDDEDIRRLNIEVLAGSGYKVDAAADGAIAWETLQLSHYHLLVTDYNMPKMSGVELLLKLHAAGMAVPVVMASGTIPMDKLKRHPWLQIDATLIKPYTPDDLLAAVRYVLHVTNVTAGQTTPPDCQDQPADQRLRA
jgi:CheY-like chemotaxis protein